jgi:membrane fusion protein (multidrug efflux system)
MATARQAAANAEAAHKALAQTELDLSFTSVVAPERGRVTRRMIEQGAYVQVGQALMSIVPNDLWVVANFKETQLSKMRPGQPVDVKVDAYPDLRLRGRVDSIQAGTGARFSLLPPENATGNFVKVVQRVPVKIVFDAPPPERYQLGPGMSVVSTVRLR